MKQGFAVLTVSLYTGFALLAIASNVSDMSRLTANRMGSSPCGSRHGGHCGTDSSDISFQA
jgi:hypothetical protein